MFTKFKRDFISKVLNDKNVRWYLKKYHFIKYRFLGGYKGLKTTVFSQINLTYLTAQAAGTWPAHG